MSRVALKAKLGKCAWGAARSGLLKRPYWVQPESQLQRAACCPEPELAWTGLVRMDLRMFRRQRDRTWKLKEGGEQEIHRSLTSPGWLVVPDGRRDQHSEGWEM